MKTIVGLGKGGCQVAKHFADYPQYDIYEIKVGPAKGRTSSVFTVPKKKSPESYEKKLPSLKNFFKKVEGSILFVVDGSEPIAAASLRVLEYLKENNITVLYLKPELQFLSDSEQMSERVVRGVLQEYARSAVFERIYLIDVPLVAATMGEVPIKFYYDRVYGAVTSTLHMITVFSHSEALLGAQGNPLDVARISTFGFVNSDSGQENLFFALDFPREKSYYYGINEKKLRTDGTLMKKVNEQVSAGAHADLKTSYAVYETKYEDDYIYLTAHSSMVQS
jgi:hypothetical protein